MDAETNVYVSENFTVMTDTMANDYLHGPEKENGAILSTPRSFGYMILRNVAQHWD
jgi:hypothetical protein